MNRSTKTTLGAQLIAVGLAATMIRPAAGAPSDVLSAAMPVSAVSPAPTKPIDASDARVSPQTGAFTYSYPIAVPPGRAGMQPELALTYSSQAPLYGGIAAGWSLDVPSISRDWSAGSLNEEERWVSSLAGGRELVEVDEPAPPEVAATYRAQGDSSYARYRRMKEVPGIEHRWEVLRTDGTVLEFGSRWQQGFGGWFPLIRVRDVHGNEVQYHWTGYGGVGPVLAYRDVELLLDRITYTFNTETGLTHHAEVHFEYDDTPDRCGTAHPAGQAYPGAALDFHGGAPHYRGRFPLTAIETRARPAPGTNFEFVRRYQLVYDDDASRCDGAHAPIRLLTAIEEVDDNGERLRPPVTFSYGSMARSFDDTFTAWKTSTIPAGTLLGAGQRLQGQSYVWSTLSAELIDLNADARPDRLYDDTPGQSTMCIMGWNRNAQWTNRELAFANSAEKTHVPPIPWSNALLPNTGSMGPGESCSLTGQLSYFVNKDPAGESCARDNLGHYNVYRRLDMDADGIPDLVTALHYDPAYYDPPVPVIEEPGGAACPVVPPDCINEAIECEDGDFPNGAYCEINPASLGSCLEIAPREGCFESALDQQPVMDDGDAWEQSNPCMPERQPRKYDDKYVWTVYPGRGDGTFDTGGGRTILSPIPLASHQGDPVSNSGTRIASSTHAIIDLDGDGYLDAVHVTNLKGWRDLAPTYGQEPPKIWWVWRGDGQGGFVGRDGSDLPYIWPVPEGAVPSRSLTVQDIPGGTEEARQSMTLLDANDDGLPDLVRIYGPDVVVHYNTGHGFTARHVELTGLLPYVGMSRHDPQLASDTGAGTHRSIIRPGDFDGDGRTDLLYQYEGHPQNLVLFNTGHGFAAGTVSVPVLPTNESLAVELDSWTTERTPVDVDGDGLFDVVYADGTIQRDQHDGTRRAVMTTIDNGHGGLVRVEYEPMSNQLYVGGPWNQPKSPGARWLASSLTIEDQHRLGPGTEQTRYDYHRPIWNQDDHGQWDFRGFDRSDEITPGGSIHRRYYNYSVDWSGRERLHLTFASDDARNANEPTTVVQRFWAEKSLFGTVASYYESQTRTMTCREGDSYAACRDHAPVQRIVRVYQPVKPFGSADVAFARTITWHTDQRTGVDENDFRERRTHALHYGDSTYLIRVIDEYVDEYQAAAPSPWSTPSSHTRHIYSADGHDETATEVWLGDGRVARTERTFDDLGNVLTVSKPRQVAAASGLVTRYDYDPFGLYAARTINELGQVVEIEVDPGTGNTLAERGPNTVACGIGCDYREETRYRYDGLGRLSTIERRTGGQNNITPYSVVERRSYADFTSPARITTERRIDFSDDRWVTTWTESDGHGRAFRDGAVAGGGDRIVTRYYDGARNLVAIERPDPSSASGSVRYELSHDSLGRPLQVTDPHGNGSWTSYHGLEVRRGECVASGGQCLGTEPGLAETRTEHDVHGRLIRVSEKLDNGSFVDTHYHWDGLGRAVAIDNPDQQTTLIEYDFIGNRTAITYGDRRWEYAYDVDGNLIARIEPHPAGADPLLYTSTMAYDPLGRLDSKVPAVRDLAVDEQRALASGPVVYEYDTTTNGTGRVAAERVFGPTDPNYPEPVIERRYQYDALGMPTREDLSFDLRSTGTDLQDTRHVIRNYNALGLETLARLPDWQPSNTSDQTVLQRSYTLAGQLDRVFWDRAGSDIAILAHNQAGLIGGITSVIPGTQPLIRSYGYDRLGRVTGESFAQNGQQFAVQSYHYDSSNEIDSLVSQVTGLPTRSMAFDYDSRHQLVAASDDQGYEALFGHTDAGRLSTVFVAAPGAPGNIDRNVSYTRNGDGWTLDELIDIDTGDPFASFAYDAAGNLTSRDVGVQNTTTFRYDGHMHLARATGPDGAERYYYDAAGNRVLVVDENQGSVRLFFGETELDYRDKPHAYDLTGPCWGNSSGCLSVGLQTVVHVDAGHTVARIVDREDLQQVLSNRLGHIVATLDGDGQLVASFQYSPFGEILASAGEADKQTRRFNGKEQDAATGLLYYGFRYYDPVSLTWTQTDPMYRFLPDIALQQPRARLLYAFSLNNPVRYLDPNGLQAVEEGDDTPTTCEPSTDSGPTCEVEVIEEDGQSTRPDWEAEDYAAWIRRLEKQLEELRRQLERAAKDLENATAAARKKWEAYQQRDLELVRARYYAGARNADKERDGLATWERATSVAVGCTGGWFGCAAGAAVAGGFAIANDVVNQRAGERQFDRDNPEMQAGRDQARGEYLDAQHEQEAQAAQLNELKTRLESLEHLRNNL